MPLSSGNAKNHGRTNKIVLPWFYYLRFPPKEGVLFRAENAVARITQSGNDIAVFIEFFVQRGDENLDIRMICIDNVYAGRRRYETHQLNVLNAPFFKECNRRG